MPYERSHGRQCIVTGCLYTEKDRYCLLNAKCPHGQLRKDCGCETVFKLHKFPINLEFRKVWVENINRSDVDEVNCRRRSYVVCSSHFPDGQPTKENPYPTLYMQEPCPQKFLAELDYSSLKKAQKPENILKDVQHVVSKLCNIICESEEETEETSDSTSKVQKKNYGLESEDSLSARRHRRTIKKTYKARTFETEKLFNKIRFGRPENRSVLISLLRQTIELPEVKECSVKLPKLNVDSTIRLSDWKDYSIHCKESNIDFDEKIDSDESYTEETSDYTEVVIKTEEDYDSLPELEFEIDNEYNLREFRESLSPDEPSTVTVKDNFSPPPAKLRKIVSPGNKTSSSPKITTVPSVKPGTALSKSALAGNKTEKTHLLHPALKTSGDNSDQKLVQIPLKPKVYAMAPKVLAAKKTGKIPVKVLPSKVSEKLRIENDNKPKGPQIRTGPVKVLHENVKVREVQETGSAPKTVQQFKVSHSKRKGSVKHTANVKVIRTYSNEKELKSNNKTANSQNSNVLMKASETYSDDDLSDTEGDLSSTSKSLQKSDMRLKQPPAISKIWTELHTHYDYTEEEEVPFSELPEIDELASYVVYEGEESDTSEDEDEEEIESELSLAEALTEEKCYTYTGLSLLVFKGLLGILKECAPKSDPSISLTTNDQLLLALMKLKMGLINTDLSVKFNTQSAICGKLFLRWLNVMYKTLNHMVVWKSRNTVIQEMPELFDGHSSLASCLIDVGHMSVQTSKKRSKVDDVDGKNPTTIKKFLYAVSPDGFVMFLSELFEEDVTEANMLAECAVINKLESGDTVFVNKEFTNGLDLPSDITFDVLPHTKTETEHESLGVISKNAVNRLKVFRILRGVITVPSASATHIMQTCAALSNLGLIR